MSHVAQAGVVPILLVPARPRSSTAGFCAPSDGRFGGEAGLIGLRNQSHQRAADRVSAAGHNLIVRKTLASRAIRLARGRIIDLQPRYAGEIAIAPSLDRNTGDRRGRLPREQTLGEFPATMLGWRLTWLLRSLRGQGGPVSDGGSGSNDSGRYAGTASAFRRMASNASSTITAAG